MVYAACSVIFLSGMMVIWYNVTHVFENASLIMNTFAFPFLLTEYILVDAMDGYTLSKSRGIWWLMLAWHKLSYREPLHKDQWSIGKKTQADFFYSRYFYLTVLQGIAWYSRSIFLNGSDGLKQRITLSINDKVLLII